MGGHNFGSLLVDEIPASRQDAHIEVPAHLDLSLIVDLITGPFGRGSPARNTKDCLTQY